MRRRLIPNQFSERASAPLELDPFVIKVWFAERAGLQRVSKLRYYYYLSSDYSKVSYAMSTPDFSARSKSPTSGLAQSVLIPEYSSKRNKRVWLTFDDGPHPTYTNDILKVLKAHKIAATFFVVGQNASNYGSIVKMAFDAGHQIGNHSYTHRDLTKLTKGQVRKEIELVDDVIQKYLGNDRKFRPPYGAHNAAVDRIAADFGYRIVLWNVDTLDWNKKYQPDGWVQHGIDQIRARDNSTVLMHDIHGTTAQNLDMFIERVKAIGNVTFVTDYLIA